MKLLGTLTIAAVLALPASIATADSAVGAANQSLARLSSPHLVGHLAAAVPVSFAITLPLRNPQGLQAFIGRLYDPSDQDYHKYLTPEEFADQFGPTEADYAALQTAAAKAGLVVTRTYKSRALLDVEGPSANVESAFGVRLNAYVDSGGRYYHIADGTVQATGAFAALGAAVVGLNDVPAAEPRIRLVNSPLAAQVLTPTGLTPAQIQTAYDMPSSLTGAGQTLALMELDGYNPGDIQQYRNEFGISGTPLQNILVDNFTGTAGDNADEVVLDIDMMLAIATNAAALLVYEAPNSNQGALDCYARIADDDRAKIVSTSWGSAENSVETSYLDSEEQTFAQMASQGQTMFASGGDDGAYDNPQTPRTLEVDDPASQPDVTGVGGTSMTLNSLGGYESETTWNNSIGSGGGGVSQIWPMPSYQTNAGLTGGKRLVPDVSINADPNKGYAIYYTDPQEGPGWQEVGGTSAGGPLWAGFTARINQQLAANGSAGIGMINTAIYQTASTPAKYTRDFHDIADGSTNLFYAATEGYDEATGWGTPIGSTLVSDITAKPSTGTGDIHAFDAGLQFFSIPFDYSGVAFDNILDQPVTLYYWDPATYTYITSPNPPVLAVHQMLGYSAKFSAVTNVENTGTDLTSGQSSLSIELQPGWNMLGNPYNLTVPLSNVTIIPITGGAVMTLAQANTNAYVYNTLYSYDPSTNQYVAHTADSLAPYTGYWIKAFQACKITVAK